MKAQPAGTLELLAAALTAVALVTLLPIHGGLLAFLTSAVSAALPVFAWVYARFRAPQHIFAIVGAAGGFAAFPAFYYLSFLSVASGFLQYIGVAALLISVGVLNLPSELVVRMLHQDRLGEEYAHVLLNGLFWAGVCGSLGHLLDRRRQRGRQSREERAS